MQKFIQQKGKALVYLLVAAIFVALLTGTVKAAFGFLLVFGVPLYFMNKMPDYATTGERFSRYMFLVISASILVFLITPVIIIIPLSVFG